MTRDKYITQMRVFLDAYETLAKRLPPTAPQEAAAIECDYRMKLTTMMMKIHDHIFALIAVSSEIERENIVEGRGEAQELDFGGGEA